MRPDTTPDELEKLVGEDEVIKEAYKALNRAYWTDNELQLYEQEMKRENDALSILHYARQEAEQKGHQKGLQEGLQEGHQKGLQEGHQEGLQEGRQEAELAIARKLLNAGLSVVVIAESTGLSLEAIERLKATTE